MKLSAALFFLLVSLSSGLTQAQATSLSSLEKLSLELNRVPLGTALNTIARQYKLNIVVPGELDGEVTLRLDSVDVSAALDAILSVNGYHYYMSDDVVVVRQFEKESDGGMMSKVVTLRYVDPIIAQKALEPLRSARGKVTVLDRSVEGGSQLSDTYHANRIILTDYSLNIDRYMKVLSQLDVPERSVLIECKIIETKMDKKTKLGILWPSQTGITGGSAVATPTSGSTTTTSSNQREGLGVFDLESGDWTWGKLTIDQVSVVLDILEQNGNSRLVSDPRITAAENHESVIRVTTNIPIQTINRFTEGAVIQDIVTFQDEEIGITLKVTPRINGDGRITLDVAPEVEDIVGFTGPINNQKPITASRSILTRVTVNDGETIALGGLLKEDEIEREQKVPLLGHIPLLGKLLFTNKSKDKATTDLLILITPRIVQ